MTVDVFTERLARVRERFAASLAGRIDETCERCARLSEGTPAAADAVEEAYRCVHGMAGVGPTVGFAATGRAAHEVEGVLRPPRSQRRGLTPPELIRLAQALQVLRDVAARELRSFPSVEQQG